METFLKRLEIQGFKSFANKTSLDFPVKIVGIVGPNGSGKSNIVDAFRWTLGERAAKNLRGESIDNLIFAGTPKKAASGLARVTITFSNNERIFPIDSEEVTLERRVDKSGNSQFFLNNSEIRLKDLLLILARAKLGTRGLTIIGQGQSDLFVKSNPKERRIMIEEILGLREFRIKKDEASRKLETSSINIEKVKAMIEELVPHVKFLRKQKHRWDRRKEIEGGLKKLEDRFFTSQFRKIRKESERIDSPVTELEKERNQIIEIVKTLEESVNNFEKQESEALDVSDLKKKFETFIEERRKIEREVVRLETTIELQKSANIQNNYSNIELKEKVSRTYDDLRIIIKYEDAETIRQKLNEIISSLEKFLGKKENPLGNIPEEIISLNRKLKEIDEKINGIKKEEAIILEKHQKANQEFRSRVEKMELKKNLLRDIEKKIQEKVFEKEKFQFKKDDLENQWIAIGRTRDELVALIENNDGLWEEDIPEIERKIMRERNELMSIGEIDEEIIKEAEETEKRYEFLSKELSDLETASSHLKNLISDLEKRIHDEFKIAFKKINEAFDIYFGIMFGGGRAKLTLVNEGVKKEDDASSPNENTEERNTDEEQIIRGVDIEVSIPRKKIKSLDMLSGGEKSLVSMAALFALISISAPPFLILDEIDAALDDDNARRFTELVKEFSHRTQFIMITHNRIAMETADILYGITMGDDGVSRTLSLKLES